MASATDDCHLVDSMENVEVPAAAVIGAECQVLSCSSLDVTALCPIAYSTVLLAPSSGQCRLFNGENMHSGSRTANMPC